MTISISVAGGVDFNTYLDDFEATFVRNGNGFFSDDPRDLGGDEFAQSSGDDTTLPIDGGLSYIAESGPDGDFSYDFATNTVGGTLDGLQFGDGLAYDAARDDFSTDGAVTILGLGLEGTGPGNEVSELLGGLRESDLGPLRALLRGDDVDFRGSKGADAFKSFGGDDELKGGKGDDTLNGARGDDEIAGGAGADDLQGGAGADTLEGGKGDDLLAGGKGRDVFVFDGRSLGDDTISGFEAGPGKGDRIDLDDLFADFAALRAATENVGGDAVIDLGAAGSITLTGVVEADLRGNDFIFD
jgi:serralysin